MTSQDRTKDDEMMLEMQAAMLALQCWLCLAAPQGDVHLARAFEVSVHAGFSEGCWESVEGVCAWKADGSAWLS